MTYFYGILIGLDVLINALIGGEPYQTISCRLGLAMRRKPWVSRLPWPAWWRAHCLDAIYNVVL